MKLFALIFFAVAVGMSGCSKPAVKKDPNEPSLSDIYVQKGVQYMENGQFDVALKDLQRAIDLDQQNSEAHNAIAVLYEKLNRTGEAEAHFKRALSANPGNSSALNNYGRFLCAQGQYEQAMSNFRQVIDSKLYKLPWVAMTNAGLCAHSTGKKEEAEEYLRKALEANPTFPPALQEMAKLSLETGQYLSARAFLQRYEAAGGSNAESLWIGVQTEHALGNREAEADYLNALSSRFPDSREAMQARRLRSDY